MLTGISYRNLRVEVSCLQTCTVLCKWCEHQCPSPFCTAGAVLSHPSPGMACQLLGSKNSWRQGKIMEDFPKKWAGACSNSLLQAFRASGWIWRSCCLCLGGWPGHIPVGLILEREPWLWTNLDAGTWTTREGCTSFLHRCGVWGQAGGGLLGDAAATMEGENWGKGGNVHFSLSLVSCYSTQRVCGHPSLSDHDSPLSSN